MKLENIERLMKVREDTEKDAQAGETGEISIGEAFGYILARN